MPEKRLPLGEKHRATGGFDEEALMCSPLGKMPFIRAERGSLCPSAVIGEYLDAPANAAAGRAA